MAGGKFSEAKLHGMTIRESADDGSDFTNPDADYRRLFLGEDGQLHVKDSAGTVTGIGGAIADILDIATAETDDTLVLAPDGAGGVEFRAEAGGTTFHGAKVWRSGTQTINDVTVTALEFDEEDYDTDSYHDVSTNPSRMTIPVGLGGKYLVTAFTGGHAASTNDDRIRFNVNSGTYLTQKRMGGLSGTVSLDLTALVVLAEGDYIEVEVYWDGTTSTAYGDASDRRATCEFSITYLGA